MNLRVDSSCSLRPCSRAGRASRCARRGQATQPSLCRPTGSGPNSSRTTPSPQRRLRTELCSRPISRSARFPPDRPDQQAPWGRQDPPGRQGPIRPHSRRENRRRRLRARRHSRSRRGVRHHIDLLHLRLFESADGRHRRRGRLGAVPTDGDGGLARSLHTGCESLRFAIRHLVGGPECVREERRERTSRAAVESAARLRLGSAVAVQLHEC